MRKPLATLGALAALCLLTAPGAGAAQELGDRCVGNKAEADWTTIVVNNGLTYPELPPLVPPEGAKVITRWRAQVAPGIGPIQQQLVALKQIEMQEDQLVGASAVETLVDGSNEFATRIPVPEYAHIGLRGPTETLYCDLTPGHIGGWVAGPWAVGETRKFKSSDIGVPVLAWVEPDVDGDGYGDESQDGCPRVAALQTPCPPAVLTGRKATVRKRAVLVDVQVNGPAQVEVSGRTAWNKTVPRGKSPGTRITTVMTTAGAPLQMAANVPQTFRLALPKAVKRRLATLPPRKALRMRVTIRVTDLAGAASESASTVKLPGRKQRR